MTFDDIAGLEFAKRSVNELVCWPMARPDIFTVSKNEKTEVFLSSVCLQNVRSLLLFFGDVLY